MPSTYLNQIEKEINHLSHNEQLRLIEQLAHQLQQKLKKRTIVKHNTYKNQLAEMAADPEIQTELQKINQEFSIAETDGL